MFHATRLKRASRASPFDMGKLVSVIGNVASGKTTLTRILAEQSRFVPYYEQHEGMLFQSLFAENPQKYGLPNQVDYFLFRANQEHIIRSVDQVGLTDGGLDLDFYLFARLFHQKGYLDAHEFALCERLYTTLRAALPAPDVVIHLQAPLILLEERWRQRATKIDAEISTISDLPVLQVFLDEYLKNIEPQRIINVNAAEEVQVAELTLLLEKL